MKITKSQLKQIIKEEYVNVMNSEPVEQLARFAEPQPVNLPEPETLLDRLEYLLRNWRACESDPGSDACQYHKDLEELVAEYGRPCGADNQPEGGFSGAVTSEPVFIEEGRPDNEL